MSISFFVRIQFLPMNLSLRLPASGGSVAKQSIEIATPAKRDRDDPDLIGDDKVLSNPERLRNNFQFEI